MADGLIVIWKERGYTSHDVVARMRGILKQKKIGHTGTLDPEAEGVLLVGLGTGTKALALLPDTDKCYDAEITFGIDTDTQDIWGEVIRRTGVIPAEDELAGILPRFTGSLEQVPPMYSAKKIGGKKLYELARSGITVERKPVPVRVSSLQMLWQEEEKAGIRVSCSAGTYIRTLIHDIGEALGTSACMSRLVRTRVCGFDASRAVKLEELEQITKGNIQGKSLKDLVIPVDEALGAYPGILLPASAAKEAHNGNPFPASACLTLPEGEKTDEGSAPLLFRVYLDGQAKEFIGIYRKEQEMFYPVRVFYRA